MYLIDTDHISLIARGSTEGARILARLLKLDPTEYAVSIISYEEQVRGWLAEITRTRAVDHQKVLYARLLQMLTYYCHSAILPFDDQAIEVYQPLWLQRLRLGTMDLKIAAIAL